MSSWLCSLCRWASRAKRTFRWRVEVITVTSGLRAPNGVAFRDGALYVAEINRVLRFDDIESRLDNPPAPVVVSDDFPEDWMHGWKYIAFGPDGKLYVPVGAPCNLCDRSEDEPKYASFTRMNPDGSDLEVFASGIRNSVGFDWDPTTHDLGAQPRATPGTASPWSTWKTTAPSSTRCLPKAGCNRTTVRGADRSTCWLRPMARC